MPTEMIPCLTSTRLSCRRLFLSSRLLPQPSNLHRLLHSFSFQTVVKVHDFNSCIPENVFLCLGGSGPQTSFPQQQRQAIADTIRKVEQVSQHSTGTEGGINVWQYLDKSSASWRLICDTDGDQVSSDALACVGSSALPPGLQRLH